MASASSKAQLREEVAGWNPGQISQAPTQTQRLFDSAFRRLCFGFAAFTILLDRLDRAGDRDRERRQLFEQYGVGFYLRYHVGSEQSAVRHLGRDLGNPLHFAAGAGTRHGFGVAAAIFLSEGYLGQFVFRILKSANLHAHPVWGQASRSARAAAEKSHRAAGGGSQRRLRSVGAVRRHSA